MAFRAILSIFLFVFPWPLRRLALTWWFGYRIDPTARIGFSILLCEALEMGPNSWIGNFTICKGLALLQMQEASSIGNLNQITGFPRGNPAYFRSEPGRSPQLLLGAHAAITERHIIDCTNSVSIGSFSTVAGYRSQILTHSIDLYENQQSSKPVVVGEYCFVGSGSILLSGSAVPDYSVLGAGSVVNKALTDSYVLYAGSPARAVKPLPLETGYFRRKVGAVR